MSASPAISRTQRPSGSSAAWVMTPRVPSALRSSPPPTSEPRSMSTMPKRASPARQSRSELPITRARRRAAGMVAWGNRTAERGNIAEAASRASSTMARPHRGTHDAAAAPDGADEGPASRPALTRSDASCKCFVLSVCSPRLQPAAQWVRGPPCRPAGTRTGANAASCIRRTSRQAELLGGATETDIGDAFSTRRIGLLGRACRLHRQLLSTRGNGGCSGCRSLHPVSPSPPAV